MDPLFRSEDIEALSAFRQLVFRGIKEALEEDGICKSSEGAISIFLPNYFKHLDGISSVTLGLYCYVMGPSRNYEWTGSTLSEACRLATKDVSRWMGEAELATNQ